MSKKAWREIFADSQSFPDDFVLSDKDGNTFSLGEARTYNKEHDGELLAGLEKRDRELKGREGNLMNAERAMTARIKQAAEAAGVSIEDFVEGKFSRRSVAEQQDLDESDPLVGKLVKELKGLRSELSATQGQIKDLKEKGIGPVINTYLEDYYEDQFDRLSHNLPKGTKLELKDVLSYAEKEGMKDSKGRYNLRKAVNELTSEARQEEAFGKRLADEKKKWEDERKVASMQPPQSGPRAGVTKQFKDEKGHTKSIEQVLQDSLQDEAIWSQVGQA